MFVRFAVASTVIGLLAFASASAQNTTSFNLAIEEVLKSPELDGQTDSHDTIRRELLSARALSNRGDVDKFMDYTDRLLNTIGEKSPTLQLYLHQERANALRYDGRFRDARDNLQAGRKIAAEIDSPTLIYMLFLAESIKYHIDTKTCSECQDAAIELLRLLSASDDRSQSISWCGAISLLYIILGEYESQLGHRDLCVRRCLSAEVFQANLFKGMPPHVNQANTIKLLRLCVLLDCQLSFGDLKEIDAGASQIQTDFPFKGNLLYDTPILTLWALRVMAEADVRCDRTERGAYLFSKRASLDEDLRSTRFSESVAGKIFALSISSRNDQPDEFDRITKELRELLRKQPEMTSWLCQVSTLALRYAVHKQDEKMIQSELAELKRLMSTKKCDPILLANALREGIRAAEQNKLTAEAVGLRLEWDHCIKNVSADPGHEVFQIQTSSE